MFQFDINPLNALDKRRVTNLPPHFECVWFDLKISEKAISDWIYEYLRGRFFLGNRVVCKNGKNDIKVCAGFEVHSEATYFSLILSDLNRKNLP